MIVFLGDVHAEFSRMRHALRNVPSEATVIQVGDFGFYPSRKARWEQGRPEHIDTVYFIDGNHEYFPNLTHTEPTEVWPHLVHLPRGTIFEVDGLKIGCLGGGTSIDKAWRTDGRDWFKEEQISEEQAAKLENKDVNLMVTHTPPAEVIARNFDGRILISYDLPATFIDPEAYVVQQVWNSVGRPPLICGHMHRSVKDGPVKILGVCETYVFPEREE